MPFPDAALEGERGAGLAPAPDCSWDARVGASFLWMAGAGGQAVLAGGAGDRCRWLGPSPAVFLGQRPQDRGSTPSGPAKLPGLMLVASLGASEPLRWVRLLRGRAPAGAGAGSSRPVGACWGPGQRGGSFPWRQGSCSWRAPVIAELNVRQAGGRGGFLPMRARELQPQAGRGPSP